MKIRGRVSEYNYVLEGPAAGLFGPSATATLNCNLDENMTGPCWGTFEWPASDEERWEGIWYGPFNLATFAGSYKAAGHGHGGRLDGLKLKIDAEYPGDRPYPYGNVSLMVFDPHGRHPGR
ncbi:MAG TPA: hypothetical protein VJH03_02610 [Blastocatellia bacterium]|nr:hypothetical protein [Blastocatellia bacterium]